MATEQGVVTRLNAEGDPPTAWVKIVRTGACESCSSRNSCNVGKGGLTDEVEAVNTVKAGIGDRIQVTMETGSLMKATFLLYLFPILCMIVGGVLGHWMSLSLGIRGSILSVLLSLAFLAAAMIIVRAKGRRMGMKSAYQPRILRVLGHAPKLSESQKQGDAADNQSNECTSLNPHNLT